ncbi:MAG: nitroreductase family protein [Deltaproteobacteria bacterium]|nr:nitroreductase family protein [Deltaproteobacteria bacterium]
MLDFNVKDSLCTRCGECVDDCPARIISMQDGLPVIVTDKESSCYRCQHCLAVCPTGALSILGVDPSNCQPLNGAFPEPDRMEVLIRGRRSVRRYKQENLEPELMQHLLDVAWQAPTGVNSRDVLFTVVDDRLKLVRLREVVMDRLGRLVREMRLPAEMVFFANFVRLWEEKRVDILFRDAPHLLIASAPSDAASPVPDCLIALSCFELYAQCQGVGTLWNGLVKWGIFDLLPGMRGLLGIPEDHVIGYVMTFGMPAVKYARTVQHGPANVTRVSI